MGGIKKSSLPNMGGMDRLIRVTVGSMFLYALLSNLTSPRNLLKSLLLGGGSLMLYSGIKGQDPVMKALGVSTIPGAQDNIINQLKQVKPGPGVPPLQTEQAIPQGGQYDGRDLNRPVAELLSIR